MSNFAQRKYDYQIYYAYIGIRVRGRLPGICIFKEYWYGRRVDPLYYPYNPRTEYQQRLRNFFSYAIHDWAYLPEAWKVEYTRQAKYRKLYGVHRYVELYMNRFK